LSWERNQRWIVQWSEYSLLIAVPLVSILLGIRFDCQIQTMNEDMKEYGNVVNFKWHHKV
jgi:hypothetical protein